MLVAADAFDMYDFDGDGRIGFMDLTKVLARCCAFGTKICCI